MSRSLFWHDYETFGIDPRRARPAQVGGIRTDEELNIIGEPLMWYCQPADDFLPEPESCLITGITPLQALQHGVPEPEFAHLLHRELSQTGTCGVGYNSIRFDDEVTRFMLWRNFYDPYGREWQNDCSRWDLLDVVRACHALRPEGIEWPRHDDGSPSFRLEHLTQANGLEHTQAHDALSDVMATLNVARLLRQHQPRLYEFCYGLRKKDAVIDQIDLANQQPFLHVSGMFPASRGCLALMQPIGWHPVNRNELIAFDLSADPTPLFDLSIEAIQQRVFTRSTELPEGMERLPIKTIHINKSPIVVRNLKALSGERAEQWGLDVETCLQRSRQFLGQSEISDKLAQVFTRNQENTGRSDVDEALYQGFISKRDDARRIRVRELSPQMLATERFGFDDPRLAELLLRYRARNWPDSLNAEEQALWQEQRNRWLRDGEDGHLSVVDCRNRIAALRTQHAANEAALAILDSLEQYLDHITQSLGTANGPPFRP